MEKIGHQMVLKNKVNFETLFFFFNLVIYVDECKKSEIIFFNLR